MTAAILRLIFFGTGEIACPALQLLAREVDLIISGVVTQPDRPKGRDLHFHPSPIKRLAEHLQLEVLQPNRARDPEFFPLLEARRPDLIVVMAYGQILPAQILSLPRWGALNIHTSLLPKYRGAAPIQWALLEDQRETGVTIMKMDAGLDTGEILSAKKVAIQTDDDYTSLAKKLGEAGAELIVRTIPGYLRGEIVPQAQPAQGVSYARKITKEDGRLSWTEPAATLRNRIRALVPWPGAYCYYPAGAKKVMLKVWKAEVSTENGEPGRLLPAGKSWILVGCSKDSLRLLCLQKEGGRPMTAEQFMAGHPLPVGTVLS